MCLFCIFFLGLVKKTKKFRLLLFLYLLLSVSRGHKRATTASAEAEPPSRSCFLRRNLKAGEKGSTNVTELKMQCDWPVLGPLIWSRYVTKEVLVTVGNNEEIRGWLQTVDPVSAR